MVGTQCLAPRAGMARCVVGLLASGRQVGGKQGGAEARVQLLATRGHAAAFAAVVQRRAPSTWLTPMPSLCPCPCSAACHPMVRTAHAMPPAALHTPVDTTPLISENTPRLSILKRTMRVRGSSTCSTAGERR